MSLSTSLLASETPKITTQAEKFSLLNIDELYSLHDMQFSVRGSALDGEPEVKIPLEGKGVILVDGRLGGLWSVRRTFVVAADKDEMNTVIEDTYEESLDSAIKVVEESSSGSWRIVLLPPEVKHVTITHGESEDLLDNKNRISVILNVYGDENIVCKAVSNAIERVEWDEDDNKHTIGLLNAMAGTYRSYCNYACQFLSSRYVTLIVEHYLDIPTHNYAGLWNCIDGTEWNQMRCLRLSVYRTVYDRIIEFSISATGDDILVEGVHYAATNHWDRDTEAGNSVLASVREDLKNTEGTLVMVGPLENLARARELASHINAKEIKVYEHSDASPKETTLVAEVSMSLSRNHMWILQDNTTKGNTYMLLYRKQINKMSFDPSRIIRLDSKRRTENGQEKIEQVKGTITLIDLQRNELVTMPLGGAVEAGYTTWSHVWDSNTFQHGWRLCDETEISSQRLVLKNSIEKTKMMLSIGRSLGIRYTWIDYVCILQTGEGSSEDKDTSIRMMGEYYRLSLHTFAYVDAVPYDLPREIAMRKYEVAEAVNNSKWRRRIWTFQEEAFSGDLVIMGRRHLIFGHQSDVNSHRKEDSSFDFNYIMMMARSRTCTLEQDYVYGMLSFLPYGKELKIDYSQGLCVALTSLSQEAGKAGDFSFLINSGKALEGKKANVHYLSHPLDFSSVENLSNKYDGRLAVESATDACGLSRYHGVENDMSEFITRGARTSEMGRRMYTLFSTRAGKESGLIKPGELPSLYQRYAGDAADDNFNLFVLEDRISMMTAISPNFDFLSSSIDSIHDRLKDSTTEVIDLLEGEKFEAPWYWYTMSGKFTDKWPFGEPAGIIEDDTHVYYCFTSVDTNLTGPVKLIYCNFYVHGTLPVYVICTVDSYLCYRVGYAICMFTKQGRNPFNKPGKLGPTLCSGMHHPHRHWAQGMIVLG